MTSSSGISKELSLNHFQDSSPDEEMGQQGQQDRPGIPLIEKLAAIYSLNPMILCDFSSYDEMEGGEIPLVVVQVGRCLQPILYV